MTFQLDCCMNWCGIQPSQNTNIKQNPQEPLHEALSKWFEHMFEPSQSTAGKDNEYFKLCSDIARETGGMCGLDGNPCAHEECSDDEKRLRTLLQNLDEIVASVGRNHRYVADRKLTIGDCYQKMLKHERAIQYYLDARDIYRNSSGDSSRQLIQTNMSLGKAYYMNGNYERSMESYHEGLDMMAVKRKRSPSADLLDTSSSSLQY